MFYCSTVSDIDEVDFNQFSSVAGAFLHLTSNMTILLRCADFSIVRRACIEQINTPSGAQLPQEVVSDIKSSMNIDKIFDTLAESPYWSWIDLRLLEAMAASSNMKQAKLLLERYKNAIFTKKLKELLPNAPSKEVKEEYYTKVVSKLNKDPDEVTVQDLLDFRQQLEEVILDIKKGVCILEHLERGCIEVYWYIPTCCIDHAYQSALQNCDQFQNIGLQHLQIGNYPVIYDPSTSHEVAVPPPQVNTGKVMCVKQNCNDYSAVKSFIDHYYDYLSVNMDAEVVAQLMVSQQLLNEDTVMIAQSNYHKNLLILQQLRLMNVQTLTKFGKLLQSNTSQQHIANVFCNGKSVIQCLY